MNRGTRLVAGLAIVTCLTPPLAGAQEAAGEADLTGLKSYMVDHAALMKAGTAELTELAQRYYDLAEAAEFDYAALWEAEGEAVAALLTDARRIWTDEAHGNYELNEGMVAGIPSLAHFDELIDAGPSGADDPAGAVDFTVELPDGRELEKPGNLFHYLTEPTLWGTEDEFVGLRVDMDGDGEIELGEALPEANVLLGSAQALDAATADLEQAIADWEPTLEDAFTALVVMIPTMSGYFEEWKLSPFVLGDESTQRGFVANSRLLDVLGILGGLQLTYEKVGPLVTTTSPAIDEQIERELNGMVDFVQDLADQEAGGTRFTPEQADQFGSELQSRATSLAGQITQAAALLDITIAEG
jgi:hypothetical protein